MHHSVLHAVAAGASEHPLIDIDLTAFVQFGIFMIALLVATKFLFRPYITMRDERTAGIDGARDEATRMSAQADAKLADYEEKLEQARNKALDERREMRAAAATTQRELTDAARAEANSSIATAQERIASDVETARKDLAPRADKLASDLVSKLLGREVSR
jgi:F-type H+-transporting ATPase subunit b